MIPDSTINEIRNYVQEEKDICIDYAQSLFGLNHVPVIVVDIQDTSGVNIPPERSSAVIDEKLVINPIGVSDYYNFCKNAGYPCDLKKSAVKTLSYLLGCEMQGEILDQEIFEKYKNLDDLIKNQGEGIFVGGVFEAVGDYNEVYTLKNYGLKDHVFENKELSDKLAIYNFTEAFSLDNFRFLSEEEQSIIRSAAVKKALRYLIGREFFERELKNKEPDEFRKWVNNWRPEKTGWEEKKEYFDYGMGILNEVKVNFVIEL